MAAAEATPHATKLSPIRVKQRIAAVDAARGCAMLLVCLSHIKQHFVDSAPDLYVALLWTTRIATPTFLLLSGFVIGHLLRGNSRGNVTWSLLDRGLFLVLVVHFLLGVNELGQLTLFEWVFGKVMITDVIGIALCIAVMIRGASTAALFSAAIALCLLSWVIAMTLVVEPGAMQLAAGVLFHLHSAPNRLIDIALLPYLGLFLAGMGLSGYCREALQAGASNRLARRLAALGAIGICIVIAGVTAWHFGKDALPEAWRDPHVVALLRATLHPGNKVPPSPAYLVSYAGAGLLLTASFFYGRPRWLVSSIASKAAVIGKASLLCFIAQDWLLFVLPQALGFEHLTSVPFWLAYLALCVVVLFHLSKQWIRLDGNRFFTIGLKRVMQRRRTAAQS
ncbi:MAG: heparan-alpha-glucosaminide N-acetyltransferase domain-containing protein [Pseudomonadota bacterium]|nr:heparan-alpha-glucosaminide N-acetyltransferase domain-containing protein [Pseudomonadota bacterium]